MLNIEIVKCLSDNYCYILHDKDQNITAVIDPSEFDSVNNLIEKKYKKLDFILNTHHHYDHVGGNIELKKKYRSKIIGFELDKKRIPGIDIFLKENQEFKLGNVKFKTIFIPGHTSGHIAFYFQNEDIIFTGDTLFSLGCGKVFEGTMKQMFSSINKIKDLPKKTKIYFGHEYTNNNLNFCLKYDVDNKFLLEQKKLIEIKIEKKIPTTPVFLEDELNTNIFLRSHVSSIKNTLNLSESSDEEIFVKLRALKDIF